MRHIKSAMGAVQSLCTGRTGRRMARQRGFTLVEMLVVVLIMALLIGLMVRTLGGAGTRADVAATQAKIEKVKAALEEFFAEYGQSPPVPFYGDSQPVYFEYPVEYPGKNAIWSGTAYLEAYNQNTDDEAKRLFTLGLMAFLLPRYDTVYNGSGWFIINNSKLYNHEQWKHLTPTEYDIQRDLDAYHRWKPFLDGVVSDGEYRRGPKPDKDEGTTHINAGKTLKDSWDQELHYESLPPHQSYKLWSSGPNKKNEGGGGDDIGVLINK